MILALIVTFFAVFISLMKTLTTALAQFGYLFEKVQPARGLFGKLAMADVFLVAFYITIIIGTGFERIEIAWGLYLFTFCVITSLMVQFFSAQKTSTESLP